MQANVRRRNRTSTIRFWMGWIARNILMPVMWFLFDEKNSEKQALRRSDDPLHASGNLPRRRCYRNGIHRDDRCSNVLRQRELDSLRLTQLYSMEGCYP